MGGHASRRQPAHCMFFVSISSCPVLTRSCPPLTLGSVLGLRTRVPTAAPAPRDSPRICRGRSTGPWHVELWVVPARCSCSLLASPLLARNFRAPGLGV